MVILWCEAGGWIVLDACTLTGASTDAVSMLGVIWRGCSLWLTGLLSQYKYGNFLFHTVLRLWRDTGQGLFFILKQDIYYKLVQPGEWTWWGLVGGCLCLLSHLCLASKVMGSLIKTLHHHLTLKMKKDVGTHPTKSPVRCSQPGAFPLERIALDLIARQWSHGAHTVSPVFLASVWWLREAGPLTGD